MISCLGYIYVAVVDLSQAYLGLPYDPKKVYFLKVDVGSKLTLLL
jgi:hypothetical protein